MRVEPAVSRAKFETEVRHLQCQADTLRTWGCLVQRVSYPEVDVVFVPRTPLLVTFSVPMSQGLIQRVHPVSFNVEAQAQEFSPVTARAFGVRVLMDDYDQRAPSVTFRDPWTWELLRAGELPQGTHLDEKGSARNVLLDQHPLTNVPFLCMRGTREYHEHPQHTGDDWMLMRGGSGLFALLSTVWRTCVQQSRLHLVLRPPNNIGLRWEAQDPGKKR